VKGRVLIIAGSDPSGGAGIQADIKTVTALGGYAAAAITALTVQDTTGVKDVHGVASEVVAAQARAALEDIGADAVKIGMLGSRENARAVAELLAPYANEIPIVIDPVLAATSGDALAEEGVARSLRERLFPLAALVTPNAPEAAALTGLEVSATDHLAPAGAMLLALGAKAALVKGGHLSDREVTDVLVTADGARPFRSPRLDTTSTHGTGCTLASAVAVGLAQGLPLERAVARARLYVYEAIRRAPGYGRGAGPLDHAHTLFAARAPAETGFDDDV